jgi:predicted PurR-regulated permease PerM
MNSANRTLLIPLAIIAIVLVGWVLHIGAAIVQPLVIALLLATLLAPLLRALERWRIPPVVSILALVTLLFFGLFQVALLTQENIAAFLRDSPLPADARGRSGLEGRSTSGPVAGADQKASPAGQSARPGGGATPTEQPKPVDGGVTSTQTPEGNSAGTDPNASSPLGDLAGTGEQYSGDPAATTSPTETAPIEDPGLLQELRDQQEAAIRDAGGLATIVEKLVARIERSSLPQPVIGYLRTELLELKNQSRAAEVAQFFLGGGLNLSRTLILVLIYMAFIFAEASILKRKILSVAGDSREDAERILDTISKGMQQFLGIKTLISIATGACAYLLLVLLKIPYALLFGFLTFALNFIPYFGSIVAGAFPTIVAVAVEPTLDKAIICALGYVAINTLLGTILEPRIMGRELDLSPLVIIVAVVLWGSLWGVVGTFLAVPIMATLQTILASSEHTKPLAVLISGGPPKESGRRIFRTAPNPSPGPPPA